METRKKLAGVVFLAGMLAVSLVIYAGGSLEPSAPPGPTMKTLDEIEPRIPIPASDTPTSTFVISEPDSYYLTGDRNASGSGIQVNADNVTIDLMGYSLIGPGSGTGSGIYMYSRSNLEVRNGTVRDFGSNGIYEFGSAGKGHRVIGVRAVSNGYYGICLYGPGHLIKDCTAAENAAGHGIWAGSGCTVTGNTAYNNWGYGITAGSGSTVTGNTANNGTNGIYAGSGSTVTGNTAHGNMGWGIFASSYCLVDQNTAYSNGENMYTGAGCQVGLNVAP